jgi:hypothetical protein
MAISSQVSNSGQCFTNVLLFDLHVIEVAQQFESGSSHPADQARSVFLRAEKTGLIPVAWLEQKSDARALHIVCKLFQFRNQYLLFDSIRRQERRKIGKLVESECGNLDDAVSTNLRGLFELPPIEFQRACLAKSPAADQQLRLSAAHGSENFKQTRSPRVGRWPVHAQVSRGRRGEDLA